MEFCWDLWGGAGGGEVEGGLVEAVFEVLGGEGCLGVGVEVGEAFGHLLEVGVGAAGGEVAEADAVAAEDFCDVGVGAQGEVVAEEVEGGTWPRSGACGRGRAGASNGLNADTACGDGWGMELWVHIGGFMDWLRFLTAKRALLEAPALPKDGLASRRLA